MRLVDLMIKYKRIMVAGHTGMVGSEFYNYYQNLEDIDLLGVSSREVDLRNQEQSYQLVADYQPDLIIMAAAKVGGILSNDKYPADFLSDNILMQTNLILAAHKFSVSKFLFFGSSCIYPKFAPQPIKETSLLTGSLEETNEAYAIAKISGVKLIDAMRKQYGRDYISVMSTSLYGPGDNFDEEYAHVIPSLIRKFHVAKRENLPFVTLFGEGSPLREFLHVKDIVLACDWLIQNFSEPGPINVGSGEEISIRQLAELIAGELEYKGEILWDESKPNGTPRKFLDSHRILEHGWKPTISFEAGIREVIINYRSTIEMNLG
jgi:GDP-L-fucose synthase